MIERALGGLMGIVGESLLEVDTRSLGLASVRFVPASSLSLSRHDYQQFLLDFHPQAKHTHTPERGGE